MLIPSKIEERNSSSARSELLSLVGVLLATLLTFASTFTFGWVYDDPPQIPQNLNLQWSRAGYFFTHHLWASSLGSQGRFYRPLLMLWFLINKTIFGLNPHWFHVTTVLAHVAATALAFFIAKSLLRDRGVALVAAAIFGLHPLQVESASWISSVNDSLAAALCFGSFLFYRKAKTEQRGRWWALAGILFFLALLTKEASIVLPAIILVDLWADSDGELRESRFSHRFLAAIITFGLVAIVWIGLRSWVLGHAAAASTVVPWSTIVFSAPKILLFNFYRILLPMGLSPHYDFHLVNAASRIEFLVSSAILVTLAWLAAVAARRNPRLWIALAWLILPLLPTLNLRWMNEDDFLHDRYLYMSMLGVGLLAGFGYAWLKKTWPQLRFIRLSVLVIAVILAFASAIQSQYWANDLILFSRAVERAPHNEWAQLNYGSALSARGKYADAAPHFVRSYDLKPGWRAADFAGFAYQQSGDLNLAERWFQAALQQDTTIATAWFGLAQIRLSQRRPEDAIPYLKKALELQPDAEGYHYVLGTALEQLSRPQDALREYEIELQQHPQQVGAKRAMDRLRNSENEK